MATKKWMGTPPTRCDICGLSFIGVFIDCKTAMGPWGLLCSKCHATNGCGLGLGHGQKYDLVTLVKLEG